MTTALDTNVLLDLFLDDPKFGLAARTAIKQAHGHGRLIMTEIVYAELAPLHSSRDALEDKLRLLDVGVEPVGREASYVAGKLFSRYRRRHPGRGRILADFLIGAHALSHADALLTRDRGFYRACFRDLKIIDPQRA